MYEPLTHVMLLYLDIEAYISDRLIDKREV
jgi:hypothetical protein